ncbi:MAG: hypothetical protein HKN84_15310 [Gammaproteobacteria bacterium]|nr:hypothetical protein [Gammaproteobacteria bacterium]
MPVLRLISIVSILLISSTALAQRFAPFESMEDRFRILAPAGEFDIDTIDFESEYGIVVPARVHKAETDGGTYTLTVVDFTNAVDLHRELGDHISVYGEVDVRASVAYVARQIRERAETIEYDNYHYIGRVDGHQLHTTNPDGTRTYAGIYLLESKLYVIDATVKPGAPPGGIFQQSLEFLDDDGNGIMFRTFQDVRKICEGCAFRD